ncbi:hypothetical protein U1Q18_030956 [Sarracenia purpurea var. burkii]
MDDTQKRGQELEVGGRVSDAKFERQQEKELPALAVTEEQNSGKTRSGDTNTMDEIPEDENLNENDVEEAHQNGNEALVNVSAEPGRNTAAATAIAEGDAGHIVVAENKDASPYSHPANRHEPITPNSLVKCSNAKVEDDSKETSKSWLSKIEEDDESGTPKDQAAFMKELESFYKERAMEFKPPRFYGQPLNCLKYAFYGFLVCIIVAGFRYGLTPPFFMCVWVVVCARLSLVLDYGELSLSWVAMIGPQSM